jgi:cell division protein FtsN
MDFSVDGQTLQLGLYRSLNGAESKQRAIAALGLTADIEKRSDQGDTLYAVLMGPLNNDEYQAAVATLSTHDMNFFHRKEGS